MAAALGILTLSGFAISAAAMDNNSDLSSQSHIIKEVRNNPWDFIKAAKLPTGNFDYIQQLNKEFVDDGRKVAYTAGDNLKALEEEYDNLKK